MKARVGKKDEKNKKNVTCDSELSCMEDTWSPQIHQRLSQTNAAHMIWARVKFCGDISRPAHLLRVHQISEFQSLKLPIGELATWDLSVNTGRYRLCVNTSPSQIYSNVQLVCGDLFPPPRWGRACMCVDLLQGRLFSDFEGKKQLWEKLPLPVLCLCNVPGGELLHSCDQCVINCGVTLENRCGRPDFRILHSTYILEK